MDYNKDRYDLLKNNEETYIRKTNRLEEGMGVNVPVGMERYRIMINDMVEKIENEKHLKRIYDLAEYLYVGGD